MFWTDNRTAWKHTGLWQNSMPLIKGLTLLDPVLLRSSDFDPRDKSILLTLSETYLKGERYEEALKYIND